MGCGSDEAFRVLIGLPDEWFRLFDESHGCQRREGVSAQWVPPVDIYEDADAFVMVAEIPGMDQEAIRAEIRGDTLVLQGERRLVPPEPAPSYHRLERPNGVFQRAFRLPEAVDPEAVRATYRDGVLRVTLPKRGRKRPVRVRVEG